ncbi:MAG: hypothetical protein HZC12_10265, partial [Nitrospirae bacterium]|nr:hypothetical protein [Nitrospirota bacterium]
AVEGAKGAANPKTREAIRVGMEKHNEFYKWAQEQGMITNEAIPGTGLRPDAIDLANKTVYELKPSGSQIGESQLRDYMKAAERVYGGKWEGKIIYYTK